MNNIQNIKEVICLIISAYRFMSAQKISEKLYLRNGTIVKFDEITGIRANKGNDWDYITCLYNGASQVSKFSKLKYIKFLDVDYGYYYGGNKISNLSMEIKTKTNIAFNNTRKDAYALIFAKKYNPLTDEYSKNTYYIFYWDTQKLNIKKIEFDN